MGRRSAQYRWLEADLTATTSACVLAYWHKPRFSSGSHGDSRRSKWFWELLYAAGADVVLGGHDHNYERFAPLDPDGNVDPLGIREFVVGTGGKSLRSFRRKIHRHSEARNNRDHGVLKLTLSAGAYSWEFVPIAGGTYTDSGSDLCH
jgi:hypothetical protein